MVDYETSQSITVMSREPKEKNLSLATDELLALGNKRGWELLVLGQAPMPQDPIHFENWMVVPAEQDQSFIPLEAKERVLAIARAGIVPKGYVIAHEIMPSLPALPPPVDYHLPDRIQKPVVSNTLREGLKLASGGLAVVAAGMVAVAGAVIMALAVVMAAALVAAPLMLLAVAQGIDPKLIAVMEDNSWVEIYKWDE